MTEGSIKEAGVIEAGVSEIGERFGAMRLADPGSRRLMVRSIEKYGQLSPVVVGPGRMASMNWLTVSSVFMPVESWAISIFRPGCWGRGREV